MYHVCVCSKHFNDQGYIMKISPLKKRLNSDAIPKSALEGSVLCWNFVLLDIFQHIFCCENVWVHNEYGMFLIMDYYLTFLTKVFGHSLFALKQY